MTTDKARELIETHVMMASGYNRNATKMILGELQRDEGQQAVDQIIKEFQLDELWDFQPGTVFKSVY